MRRISRVVRVFGFLLASAVCAGPASAGSVFMKFDLEGTDQAPAAGKEKWIEIQSFHWGPRQSTSMDGSRGRTGNQVMLDDKTGNEKARRGTTTVDANEKITIDGGRTEGDPDRPVIAGSVPDTTGAKRQHGAVTISKEWGASAGAREHDKRTTWVERSAPEAKGSVWVRVATPWAACRTGARYPMIELGDGKASYRLSDVVVTGCDGGGATLDYAKVSVRGWDPAKKQE